MAESIYNAEENLLLQSTMNAAFLISLCLEEKEFLPSEFFGKMQFVLPIVKDLYQDEKIGIGNQGMMLCCLYSLLVLPKEKLQNKYPSYAENFPVWANQASAMLQIAVWSGLRELEIGASLQHYNPVIDKAVKELLNVPEEYVLIAQMPFGAIGQEPAQKEKEDIKKRVTVIS